MPRRLVVAAGLAAVPALRLVAWALLFASVWVTILGLPAVAEDRIRSGAWPAWLHLAPGFLFGAFILAFSAYRFVLVRKGRYSAARAYLQVGLGVLVLTWVASVGSARFQASARGGAGAAARSAEPVAIRPLLFHDDPRVRAVACEALAARPVASDAERSAARRLARDDPSPQVRAACARAVRRE